MYRREIEPRPDWRARVEAQGLIFHTHTEDGVYWGEGTYYAVTPTEADAIEAATAELHARCLDAVEHVVAHRRCAELGISAHLVPLVERSWRARAPALYGRMDLAMGSGTPKLLEYNADTPTSLLEGAVIQWTWLADCFPALDQANAIHDKLIARWRELGVGAAHFASVDDLEDAMTCAYLRDTAQQAGVVTHQLLMEDVGWDRATNQLVDLEARPIATLFKLYPWEGLATDPLWPVLPALPTRWLEPAWKMILSNKAILPILWELFPGHPNLLPAGRAPIGDAWVKKPLLGREGSNVTIRAPGIAVDAPGPYGSEGYIYQAYAELGDHAGMRPVIGSWVIGDAPAGFGIRETTGYVTGNTARFVPHVVAD